MKQMWKSFEFVKSHCFHILFILSSYYFHILGPGTRDQKCENNIKNNMKRYENNVISNFHMIFASYSYDFYIFIIFVGSRPRSGPHKSYVLSYSWSYVLQVRRAPEARACGTSFQSSPPIQQPPIQMHSVTSVTSSNPLQSCQHPGIQAPGLQTQASRIWNLNI